MDFSKIKKIFYIVAIISMLLSIKSKVFAYSYTDVQNECITDALSRYKNSFNIDGNVLLVATDKDNYTYIAVSGDSDVEFLDYTTENPNFRLNGEYQILFYRYNNTTFDDRAAYGKQVYNALINNPDSCYSPYIIKEYPSGNIIYTPESSVFYPSFDNTEEIKQGYPDGVIISPHDFSNNDDLYFHLLRIDNTVPNSDTSVYYYSDHTFLLNKDSDYYRTWNDPSIEGFYYYIPRYNLKLSTDSSYLYVLNNSSQQIQNSFGLYSVDTSKGIFDVIQSDTAGVITSTEEQTDLLKNMEQQSVENANSINNINNTLNDNTVSSDTETNIDNSLKFDNKNEGLNNLNSGFFSRLTSMLSNLLGYNLSDDTSVSLPLPNSDKSLILHSKDIYDNVAGSLRTIINAFWTFIFTFYLWKFINKIYISVTSGNILDSFSSSGEAITNDML